MCVIDFSATDRGCPNSVELVTNYAWPFLPRLVQRNPCSQPSRWPTFKLDTVNTKAEVKKAEYFFLQKRGIDMYPTNPNTNSVVSKIIKR